MPDLLVPLYKLPQEPGTGVENGVTVRRALAPEMHAICAFAQKHFNKGWASECSVAMAGRPPGVYLAVEGKTLLGFACYDATARGFFGPTGVSKAARGKGLGRRLLLATLHAMREAGYGYAVIGGAGPVDFYRRHCPAIEIPDSEPGIYEGMLR
ncbi:GNAT family N-acetyltransferase [Chelativorans salis]|uniref:GNAT family N-acetyltransferase n=1 Tax=Chelativorans salis TaxID=2978478 RepID=A0ABT2LR76_9HYPH|nr:GNAT family N-acetyltransferase [Chelativorans sp. EGI FJ00035]MCT7377047.1 GNAT family N-acetyltransferase [Chelativorans sp. EGI FJ00035]